MTSQAGPGDDDVWNQGSSPNGGHASSSSQLSSPPSLSRSELPKSISKQSVEVDMDVEEVDQEEEEEDEGDLEDLHDETDDESMIDDRPIVHSMSCLSIRYLRREVTYRPVEARVKATANCQQHLMESNIRDFVGANVEYLTTGDQVKEWEEVTYLGMNLESLVVAEICESALKSKTKA